MGRKISKAGHTHTSLDVTTIERWADMIVMTAALDPRVLASAGLSVADYDPDEDRGTLRLSEGFDQHPIDLVFELPVSKHQVASFTFGCTADALLDCARIREHTLEILIDNEQRIHRVDR